MGTDVKLLMGQVIQDPYAQEQDVEKLLVGLLQSLIEEQKLKTPASAAPAPAEEVFQEAK